MHVELHLIAKREEGGVYRAGELQQGAQLQQGDQVQLRFKLGRDVEVYAFLYDSEGVVEALFPEQFVYSGIDQYGPSENQSFVSKENSVMNTASRASITNVIRRAIPPLTPEFCCNFEGDFTIE